MRYARRVFVQKLPVLLITAAVLAAAAIITQTLIELVCELIYIRVIPALVWRA